MSAIKLYGVVISPPVAFIMTVFDYTGIEYEIVPTHPFFDTKSEEYKKINPKGRIPAIQHGDYLLDESIAIARYIATIADKKDFYPYDDPKKLGKINSQIDTEVMVFRKNCTGYAAEVFFGPWLRDAPMPPEERVAELQKKLDDAFLYIKDQVTLSGGPFINGEEPTLPDFTAFFCIIPEIVYAGGKYDTHEEVGEWYNRVKEIPAVAKVLGEIDDKKQAFFDETKETMSKKKSE